MTIRDFMNHTAWIFFFDCWERANNDGSWHPKKWETKNLAESALVEIRMMASFSHPKMKEHPKNMSSWVLESLKSTNSGVITTVIGGTNKNLRVIGTSGGSSPGTRIPGLVKAKPTTWFSHVSEVPTTCRSHQVRESLVWLWRGWKGGAILGCL